MYLIAIFFCFQDTEIQAFQKGLETVVRWQQRVRTGNYLNYKLKLYSYYIMEQRWSEKQILVL